MHYKLIYTVEEALAKLENYCVYRERCHKEVEQKLIEMNMIPQARERIILHLIEKNFLNEERFAKAYVRGKFRIKKWGKKRLVRELKLKGVSKYSIQMGLNEISEEEYLNTFIKLSESRFNAIKETNKNKKKKKFFNFLVYRGWETHLIYKKMNELFN